MKELNARCGSELEEELAEKAEKRIRMLRVVNSS